MSRTLHADDYVTVTLDETRRVVHYRRSSAPFPSLEQLRAVNAELAAAVSRVAPESLSILIDVRDAPPRNDEAFEAEVTRAMGTVVSRFRAHAFLTKTAVGGLQIRRLTAARGVSPHVVFSDESEALAHLAGA